MRPTYGETIARLGLNCNTVVRYKQKISLPSLQCKSDFITPCLFHRLRALWEMELIIIQCMSLMGRVWNDSDFDGSIF